MKSSYKAIVLRDGGVRKEELARTGPVGRGVRIRISRAGVCSTDVEMTRGYKKGELESEKMILGHEFVGIVEEIGSDCPKSMVGKRVVGEINVRCAALGRDPRCDLCAVGDHMTPEARAKQRNHCRARKVVGILDYDGSFAERMDLPLENVRVVPEGIPTSLACYAEPLAAALRIREQFEHRNFEVRDKSVAILGIGALGSWIAVTLMEVCPNVTLLSRGKSTYTAESLNLISTLANREALHVIVEKCTRTFDVVVDCTGAQKGFESAVRLCEPTGTLVLKSTCAGSVPVELSPLVVQEIFIMGSRCGDIDAALEALERYARDEDNVAAIERSTTSISFSSVEEDASDVFIRAKTERKVHLTF